MGVTWSDNGRLYGAVNARAMAVLDGLGPDTPVSPNTLAAEAKTERWKALWFPDATLHLS